MLSLISHTKPHTLQSMVIALLIVNIMNGICGPRVQ